MPLTCIVCADIHLCFVLAFWFPGDNWSTRSRVSNCSHARWRRRRTGVFCWYVCSSVRCPAPPSDLLQGLQRPDVQDVLYVWRSNQCGEGPYSSDRSLTGMTSSLICTYRRDAWLVTLTHAADGLQSISIAGQPGDSVWHLWDRLQGQCWILKVNDGHDLKQLAWFESVSIL